MRLIVTFSFEDVLKLPLHYNYYIQGLIYKSVSKELSTFLHNEGFCVGKRSFKFFTFSRLNGKFRIVKDEILFQNPISLMISSPVDKFVQELGNSMIEQGKVELCRNTLTVESIKVQAEPKFNKKIKIRMLTPVVVYSTLFSVNGKKKTYYYSPYEEEFAVLVNNNLKKKYEAFFGKKTKARDLEIKIIGKPKEKVLKYKNTIIKGWLGKFTLKGNQKLLKLAYHCGIGSKNSQGFGLFEVV